MSPNKPTLFRMDLENARLPASGPTDPQVYADEVVKQGYSIVEGIYTPAEVDEIRAELEALYEESGRPPLFSRNTQYHQPNIQVERSGATFYSVADRRPGLAKHRLKPFLFEVLRRILGDDFLLDITLCLICDNSRPYLEWHTHVGGLDHDIYKELYGPEKLASLVMPRRMNVLVYLDDISPEGGQLLLYPKVVDPMTPPYPAAEADWEGHVAASFPRGTAVLLDQSAWHAATHRALPGLRMIFGIYASERRAPHRLTAEGYAVPEGLLIEPVPPTHPGMNPAVGMQTTALPSDVLAPSAEGLKVACPGWEIRATRTDGRYVYFYVGSASGQCFIVSAGPEGDIGAVFARTPGVCWRYRADDLPEEDRDELVRVIPVLHSAAAPTVTGKAAVFASASEVPLEVSRGEGGERSSDAPSTVRSWEWMSALEAHAFHGWAVASAHRQGEKLLVELLRNDASREDDAEAAPQTRADDAEGQGAGESMTLQIESALPEVRAFRVLDGVAYSYRGSLDKRLLAELPLVLQALHPRLLPYLQKDWAEAG